MQAARAALDGEWGKMSALERGDILMRMGQKVLDNAEELAQLEALDTGKPMATARNDIQVLARYLEFYGTAADKVHGEVIRIGWCSAVAAPRHRLHHLHWLERSRHAPPSRAAKNFVKVALELGGKSTQVIFEDADFDRALPIIKAIVQNSGQTCTAGSRLVQRSIYDSFVGRVAEAFAKMGVGTPEMDRHCGPLINRAQLDRVKGYVDQARRDGIPVLAEGKLDASLPKGGYYVAPTRFGPVPADHALAFTEPLDHEPEPK